jgi:hypothetical protein
MRYRLARTSQDMRDARKDVAAAFRRTFVETRPTGARWRVIPRGLVMAAACIAMGASLLGHPPATGAAAAIDGLRQQFLEPPDDSRIMMRWWWFGPAITDDEIARELRAMKQGGIGGVEIQPVYPVALDDASNGLQTVPFLSQAFLDRLTFAAATARSLGLRVDLTLGSGWPYGGPSVGIRDAAGKLRVERVRVPAGEADAAVPDVGAGEAWIAAFLVKPGTTEPIAGAPIVTTIAGGRASFAPDGQERELLAFISSRTGMMVKRPTVGAEGFVLNHYDRSALARYLDTVGRPLLGAFPAESPPHAIFCDSLEVYGSDWTPRLLEEFQRRRGYDLTPHLPALAGDATPASAPIRHDWGQTLTELVGDEFLGPLRAWATSHGTALRAQVYGIPPASVSSNALVDFPEGEGAQWRELRATRWAASASHVAGTSITSSETWTWLHSPSFMASPLDLKAEADRHFLQGVNQLIGHGWPYSPPGAGDPGWRFYAAGVFNDRNPWWIVMPDLARSFQRLSFLMRQGTPVVDVALLLPVHDAWAAFAPGNVHLIDLLKTRAGPDVIPAILDAGFNLDFVDPMTLSQDTAIDGRLLRVGAQRYRAVVLPRVERTTPETLRLLDGFARAGGTVIAVGARPSLPPGFATTAADREEISAIARRLFDGTGAPALFVAEPTRLGHALQTAVTPDVSFQPSAPAIGIVHRRLETADLFFVANTSNVTQTVAPTFGTVHARAEWWDPATGDVKPVEVRRSGDGRHAVSMELAPYMSGVLVFSDAAQAPEPRRRRPLRALIDLSLGWTLSFPGGDPIPLDRLTSWTDLPGRRGFSGVATYERDVTLAATDLEAPRRIAFDFGLGTPTPETPLRNGMRAWLDAAVREAAVVYVNGARAGATWAPPFRVAIGDRLVAGKNAIRVDVANLAINAMAASALPDYRLLNLRYGVRFEPQDMDLVRPMPSGLLGPITLIWE